MTETEAKIIAAELEHNHDWRVVHVYPLTSPFSPGNAHLWVVWLSHRRSPYMLAVTDAHFGHIKRLLARELPSDVRVSIAFTPSFGT